MNCREATELVEKKRDGKLDLWDRMGLWIHMGYCSLCRLFSHQSEIIDKSFAAYADDIEAGKKIYPLDPSCKEALSKTFKEELDK